MGPGAVQGRRLGLVPARLQVVRAERSRHAVAQGKGSGPVTVAPPLRAYQAACVASTVSFLDAGRLTLVVAPTGAGKSRIARGIVDHYAVPTLAITHTDVLRHQTAVTVPGADVCSVQGLVKTGRLGDARRGCLRGYGLFFFDEAHHGVSEEWRAVFPIIRHGRVFGATATPRRSDGTPMGDVWEEMVVAAKYSELVEAGHLCPCDVASPDITRKIQKRKKQRPDGVAAYIKHARRVDGTWRPGIYFDSTKSLCLSAAAELGTHGVRAVMVCDETGPVERQAIFDAYSRGELDVLCSPMALAEGFDSARAEVCVLRRSAQGISAYLQMVGRVLRPYTQAHVDAAVQHWAALGFTVQWTALIPKERALLVDIVDAKSVHGMPTDNRKYSLLGKGIELEEDPEDEEEKEAIEREPTYYEKVEATFEIIRDRIRDTLRELHTIQRDREYKSGWVFHELDKRTGILAPRLMPSAYASPCAHCRKRVKVGEPILWAGPKQAYHEDCWPASLSAEQLEKANAKAPKALRLDIPRPPP